MDVVDFAAVVNVPNIANTMICIHIVDVAFIMDVANIVDIVGIAKS